MPDFASALYLGLRHEADELAPWRSLTTGRPAAAGVPILAREAAASLATLMGCARGLFAPSTLHLFFDVFDALSREPIVIFAEKGLYPIIRWGVERAVAKGARLRGFPPGDLSALTGLLRQTRSRRRPVIVAEGLRPARGLMAPLPDYVALMRAHGGLVVIDDTQALGVIGRAEARHPYGRGGGGVAAHFGLEARELVIGASLAKGFGAPLAVLAGAPETIDFLEAASATRVHCSPPSLAALTAAAHALEINRRCGDFLRRRLAARVMAFRAALRGLGLYPSGGPFPVQTLEGLADPLGLYAALMRRGVSCVAHEARAGGGAALSFLISAAHSANDIAACASALAQARAFQSAVIHSGS